MIEQKTNRDNNFIYIDVIFQNILFLPVIVYTYINNNTDRTRDSLSLSCN